MGLFWDLVQQSQISEARGKADSMETRVLNLEKELQYTRQTLHELISLLEKHFGEDINRNGRIGT